VERSGNDNSGFKLPSYPLLQKDKCKSHIELYLTLNEIVISESINYSTRLEWITLLGKKIRNNTWHDLKTEFNMSVTDIK
jgi:hypothetical protein